MAGRRSEEASARRVRQAQQAGRVPPLVDLQLVSWALSLWLFVRYFAVEVLSGLQGLLVDALSAIARDASAVELLAEGASRLLTLLVLPLLIFAAAAALPLLIRRRFGGPVGPGLRNPLAGLRSPEQGLSLGAGVARGALFLLLSLQVIAVLAPSLRSLGLFTRPAAAMGALSFSAEGLTYRLLVAVLLVAPVGLWLSRMLHRRGLRMTREERQREQLQEELHPRMLGELRHRATAHDGPTMPATHAIAYGSQLLQLVVDDAGQRPPQLVGRTRAQSTDSNLPRLQVPLELARRLAQLSPGDSVPRACYPPLARAVADLRATSTEHP